MKKALILGTGLVALLSVVIDLWFGTIPALVFLLLAIIAGISLSEPFGAGFKLKLTAFLGSLALFLFAAQFGIPASPNNDLLKAFDKVIHFVHLEIFVFLFGLYLVVNAFSYSGLLSDLTWRIVRLTQGRLSVILPTLMVLTSLLSGLFDGATVASIMGLITLTILLAVRFPTAQAFKVLLLLVIATNIGGVWFVLGEPTNILAAEKLGLSPLYFLRYASPFALVAIVLLAFLAWRLARGYEKAPLDQPQNQVLLEGLSLRRVHSGTGNLVETLEALGTVEPRLIRDLEHECAQGTPDFEAALKVGIAPSKVYDALKVNLQSEELAERLWKMAQLKLQGDPSANEYAEQVLVDIRAEYHKRAPSRGWVLTSAVVLMSLLTLHALWPPFPTWLSTTLAAVVALAALTPQTRKHIFEHAWKDLSDALFLLPVFAVIAMLNVTGVFAALGNSVLNFGKEWTALGILWSNSLFSAFADNIAIMDIMTNVIVVHPDWSYFALASIVGTALGGFLSPIASVQAIILATLIRRLTKVSFGAWFRAVMPFTLVYLPLASLLLFLFGLWGWPALGER